MLFASLLNIVSVRGQVKNQQVFYLKANVNGIIKAIPTAIRGDNSFDLNVSVDWIDPDYRPVKDNNSQIVLNKDSLLIFPKNQLTCNLQAALAFNTMGVLNFKISGAVPDSIAITLKFCYASNADDAKNPSKLISFLGKKPKYLTVSIVKQKQPDNKGFDDKLSNLNKELSNLSGNNKDLLDKNKDLLDKINDLKKQIDALKKQTPRAVVSTKVVHVFKPVFEKDIKEYSGLQGNFNQLIVMAKQQLERLQKQNPSADSIRICKDNLIKLSQDYFTVKELQDTSYNAYLTDLKAPYGAVPELENLQSDFQNRHEMVTKLKKEAEDIINQLNMPVKNQKSGWGDWWWLWIIIAILLGYIYYQHNEKKKLQKNS